MKQTITYEKTRITVDYPIPIRKGQCMACLRKVGEGIKVTANHHTRYAYELATVKNCPLLALDNRLELCFTDHKIADAFRELLLSNPRGGLRNIIRIMQVVKLLSEDQQEHFAKLCEAFLAYWLPIQRKNEIITETQKLREHGT